MSLRLLPFRLDLRSRRAPLIVIGSAPVLVLLQNSLITELPELLTQRSHRATNIYMQLSQTTHTQFSFIHSAFVDAPAIATGVAAGGVTVRLRLAAVSVRDVVLAPGKEDSPSVAHENTLIGFYPNLHCEDFASALLSAEWFRAACALKSRPLRCKQLPARPDSHTTVRTPHPIPEPDAVARPALGHRFLSVHF